MKSFQSTKLKREAEKSSENWSFCEFSGSDFYAMKEGDHLYCLHIIIKSLCQLI